MRRIGPAYERAGAGTVPGMHVGSLRMEVRIPLADSLKARRAVVTPIVEGARRRHHVASADIDGGERHDRAVLGFAAVNGSPRLVTEVLDEVARFVWSFPELEVVDEWRDWLDIDQD